MTDTPTDQTAPRIDAREALQRFEQLEQALHRPYLTYASLPGDDGALQEECLVVAAHARDTVQRAERYIQDTGLDPDQVYFDPIVTVPLPKYREDDDGAVRFGAPHAAAYWHPLAWLPERQAMPLTYIERDDDAEPDDEGIEVQENDAEWALRLAFELTAAGLYNPSTGWVDVLALHGIRIDTPAGLARVEAWVAGGSDIVLDSIDLEPYFAAADALYDDEWALDRVGQTFLAYQSAAWHVAARTLADDLAEASSAVRSADGLADVVLRTAAVASQFLRDLPPLDARDELTPAERLDEIGATVDPEEHTPTPDVVQRAAADLAAELERVRSAFDTAETDLEASERAAAADLEHIFEGAAK